MKRTLRGILIASSLVLLTACGAAKTDASQPMDGETSATAKAETQSTDSVAGDKPMDSTAAEAQKEDAMGGITSATKQKDGMTAEKDADTAVSGAYHKITAEEAKKMIDKGGVTIVDVRTEAEYKEGHIENAILIPNETITTEPPKELSDKSATVMLYCRSGRRSKEAADKLIAMGYEKVYDFGGIKDWPYDTVTEK